MALDCVSKSDDDELPCKIVDTSTLSISLDNMGVATLSISILLKEEQGCDLEISTGICELELGSNAIFRGFIESDSPVKLQGTKYTEHRITAIGEICAP